MERLRRALWTKEGWCWGAPNCAGIEKKKSTSVKGGLRRRGYGVWSLGSDVCD